MSAKRAVKVAIPEIEGIFAPMVGSLVWDARRGHGSFLTMEFGQPHLSVREPVASASEPGSIVHRLLSRRHVAIVGDWHLWIQHASWSIDLGDKACDNDSAPAEVDDVLSLVNGQRLSGVVPSDGALFLQFDLGATLRVMYSTSDRGAKVEQWALHPYRGQAAICFGDGRVVQDVGRT